MSKIMFFVDSTTLHLDTTNELAKVIEAHSAEFLACPGMSRFVVHGVKR
jgi:3-hydroxyisobutyrate dehydrogenase-like beta-hydroxyacid dehydrogenase